ncbi:LexA family transcriptional regulator [Desulfonatronovibrio hydrogenovorans]|uniref:LexA family transcriptional regulator n=1 Tax=Desulfonatronovibrio hydrogenovorans TaxID=53245 RepID=UPI00048F3E63|nr:S24 family peptidase [Desulfonatronovibrio hydrogenovorans]
MNFDVFFQRIAKVTDISTQRQLADVLGVGPAAITLAKTRGIPKGWGLKIASIFGLNPVWISTGQGPVYQAGREQTFFVPKVSARACAGSGSLEVQDNILEEIPFSSQWINKKGRPGSMVVMEVTGDSMSPELEQGDNILIDQSCRQLSNQALFVVGLGDSIQVKRIQSAPGLVILLSTNRRYSPVTLQGDEIETLRIIGQVIWSSREY